MNVWAHISKSHPLTKIDYLSASAHIHLFCLRPVHFCNVFLLPLLGDEEGGMRPAASTQRRRTVDKMRQRHRDRILQRKAGGVSAEQQDRAAAKVSAIVIDCATLLLFYRPIFHASFRRRILTRTPPSYCIISCQL